MFFVNYFCDECARRATCKRNEKDVYGGCNYGIARAQCPTLLEWILNKPDIDASAVLVQQKMQRKIPFRGYAGETAVLKKYGKCRVIEARKFDGNSNLQWLVTIV